MQNTPDTNKQSVTGKKHLIRPYLSTKGAMISLPTIKPSFSNIKIVATWVSLIPNSFFNGSTINGRIKYCELKVSMERIVFINIIIY